MQRARAGDVDGTAILVGRAAGGAVAREGHPCELAVARRGIVDRPAETVARASARRVAGEQDVGQIGHVGIKRAPETVGAGGNHPVCEKVGVADAVGGGTGDVDRATIRGRSAAGLVHRKAAAADREQSRRIDRTAVGNCGVVVEGAARDGKSAAAVHRSATAVRVADRIVQEDVRVQRQRGVRSHAGTVSLRGVIGEGGRADRRWTHIQVHRTA